ncbi:MAG: HAD family hydrolase [Prevotellaceae bacterium]|nr:HAD family hydrolase [Prevotellaceae bacterium]
MKKIVVFDLDDTLYNEIDYLNSAFREIAEYLEATYSISNIYDFMLQKYSEGQNVYDEINKNYSLNISKEKFLLLYRNHIPDIQLDNATKTTLTILQKNDCILGIITDGREITQTRKIKALALSKFFEQGNIIISESFGSEKPSSANYTYFEKKYSNSKFYYIGNSTEKDFVAPNKLGWTTICILDNGKHIHKQDFSLSKEYLPKYNVRNLIEIYNLIF